jgi:disulfide bond formation protein DsbB
MTLDAYSTVLVLGSIGLFVGLLIALVGYAVSSKLRSHILGHPYERYIAVLAVISILSIIGSLIFQLVYETPVCELCWWQRIFLYPVSVITLVALWFKTRETHVTVGILSAFGLWYALYHYYFHFQRFVLGNTLTLPCSYGGLMPACTDSPILIFGFATIPFLGIMVFGSMLIVVWFARMKLREVRDL